MTYRAALSDIATMLQQNIENRKFSYYQILFWILCISDKLKAQHIVKISSGAFIHQYIQVPVVTDSVTGRKYVNLPSGIYDFDLDTGIEYISWDYTVDGCEAPFTSVTFSRTTPASSRRLYFTEEERPSPSNPYFYRIGDRIFLLGAECINITNLEMGLFSTFDPNTICNLDDEFDFPQELYDVLKIQLLNTASWGLAVPNNRTNTGNFAIDNELENMNKNKAPQEEKQSE